MKRVFKWIGLIVLGIVLIIGGCLGFIALSGLPQYKAQKIDLKVQSTPERVAKGRKMASMLCIHCHLDPATKRLSGTQMKDLPPEFGTAFSKNITQHPTKGIGSWSDGDIAFVLRTGIHPKTGLYVPPWMPKFLHMSDEDIASIISFLRSDDPLVAAHDADNRPSQPTFFAKFLSRVAFTAYDYPTAPIPQPDTTNPVVWGKYLAFNYDCFTCHSGNFADMDVKVPEKSYDFFGGGNMLSDPQGKNVQSANLTPDKATGIGSWSEEQFVNTLRTGVRWDGHVLKFPMVRTNALTDSEIKAIYAYLKTVPAINKQEVVPDTYADAANGSHGRQLFYKYNCVRCHGPSGAAVANLLEADAKYPDDSILVDVIYHNDKYNPDSFMPLFAGHISNEDALALAAYVRELGKKKGA